MPYVVSIEGQTIPVPDEIGADDQAVKRALASFYPDVANAMITRVEKGGVTTINVVKKAGLKGSGLAGLDYLRECPGGRNPAIALYQELQSQDMGSLDPERLLTLGNQLETALSEGEAQLQAVVAAHNRLLLARAQAAPEVVTGF